MKKVFIKKIKKGLTACLLAIIMKSETANKKKGGISIRKIKRFDGRIEKEIWWERSNIRSEKQIIKLVKEAAVKLEWDPDIVEDIFKERWDGFGASYNDEDYLFGFDVDYNPVSRQVRIYMFAEI